MEKQRLNNLLGALSLALADRVYQAVSAEAKLGETTVFALVLLSQRPAVTIDTLAKLLGLAHSTVVRLVENLVGGGYIERKTGIDKRSVVLSIAPAGLTVVKAVSSARLSAIDKLTDQLTGLAQATLIDLCGQMLAAMSTDAVTAIRNCRLCDESICNLDQCPVEQQYRSHIALLPTGVDRPSM